MHMEPLVLANELLNDEAPVNGAAIPEQHNRSAQVVQKVTQEADNLHPCNVGAMETEVKSKPLARWGDGDCGDGRNPLPAVAVSKDRGMADRRPSLTHVRDKEESAFVEEYEMGPKSLGFFLTRATPAFYVVTDQRCGPFFHLLCLAGGLSKSNRKSKPPCSHAMLRVARLARPYSQN